MKSCLHSLYASPAPFRQSSISLAGLVMCILACVICLMMASADQTGEALSHVSNAFCEELDSRALVQSPRSQDKHQRNSLISFARPSSGRSIAIRQSLLRFPGELTNDDDDDDLFSFEDFPKASTTQVEVLPSEFHHLLTELRRHCDVTAPKSLQSAVTIDLIADRATDLQETADVICQIVDRVVREPTSRTSENADFLDIVRNSPSSAYELRITLWAYSPSYDAMSSTVAEAAEMARSVQFSMEQKGHTSVTIASQGKAWSIPNRSRPRATIEISSIESSLPFDD